MRRPAAALILTAALLASFVIGPVHADTFDDASSACTRGDYETAYRLFKPLAEQGDAGAQSQLAAMYYNGLGIPQDYAEAARWLRKAADQGDAKDQSILGLISTSSFLFRES